MFKFKVGDKLVLKEEGIIKGTLYSEELLERLTSYGYLEVTEVEAGCLREGYAVTLEGNHYKEGQLWVAQYVLEKYFKLKQEVKLTPKLIESLDELQVGDLFSDEDGDIFRVLHNFEGDLYPIKTDRSNYNLLELKKMGAYKVKVEPYEMVEVKGVVEEGKPKLYELVEGEVYVKLEKGDVVKFLAGLELSVVQVDTDDDDHPYEFRTEESFYVWIYTGFLVPENIISINGVNIHEEYVGDAGLTPDPYEGWVVGATVKCLKTEGGYEEDATYALGWCDCDDNDFGVINGRGLVLSIGCLISDDKAYANEDISEYFELIKG